MSTSGRWAAALLALVACLMAARVMAAPRLALVIGNGDYASRPLHNPVNDARLLREALQSDAFTVTYLENADRGQMVRAIQAFGRQLTAGGKEAVGLFYFSGHGVQSEGHNFLLPVKASIQSEADLLPEAVEAEWVLKQMEQAKNGLNIVILDACRNNPLPGDTKDELRGLATMRAPPGSVVAFATDAGTVAADGAGRNSPYAAALALYMRQEGLEMKAMFDAVTRSVYDATKSTPAPQIPVQTYKLTPAFYFRGGASVPPPGGPAYDPRAAELLVWQSALKLGTVEAYQDYLTQYPKGQFGTQAKLQIAALARPASAAGGDRSVKPLTTAHGAFHDCEGCPEMVWIPAGSFEMGSPPSEKGRAADEGPVHKVTISGFALGQYPVTFEEWDACVAAQGCARKLDDAKFGRGRRPVISASWEDAQQYIRWLSQRTGHAYRLPSEAEWEFAARALTTTPYYWGNDFGKEHCAGGDPHAQRTAVVGSFPPNPWGLYDMVGNIAQWVQDRYHSSYAGAPVDGSAWEQGKGDRVLRGGSWNSLTGAAADRAACRNLCGDTAVSRGFRVARSR